MEKSSLILKEILSDIEKPFGVEVGCFLGYFSRHILKNIKNSRLAIIDVLPNISNDKDKIKSNYSSIRKEIIEYIPKGMIIQMQKEIACEKYENERFDFIFFNTDNNYNEIKSDILMWIMKIKNGGFICGNNYGILNSVTSTVLNIFGSRLNHSDDIWWSNN